MSNKNVSPLLRDEFLPNNGVVEVNNINRIHESVDRFKEDINDILKYRNDALSVAKQVPELCRQLQMDQIADTQKRAADLVHNYAREPSTRPGLASTVLIDILVKILHKATDQKVQDDVALSLQNLSKIESAARDIIRLLPINILLQMLRHPSDIIVFTAISILHQYIHHFNLEALDEIREKHGPSLIAELFNDPIIDRAESIPENFQNSPLPNISEFNRILTIASDTLRLLAFENQSTKIILLSTSLNSRLVRILNSQTKKDKLRFAIARLIKVLSVCPDNKVSLVNCGAIQALANLLFSQHHSLVLEALWALRNLSDQAIHLVDLRQLLTCLIQLLSSKDEHVATCSAGCLCNLTCQNPNHKALLIELGGVPPLCATLLQNATREEITEPVCSALRHVTHHNNHYEAAIYQIKQSNCIQVIVNLLTFGNDPSSTVLLPLVKAVLGLIRNLALDKECRLIMSKFGAVVNLSKVLMRSRQLLQRQVSEMEVGSRLSVAYTTLENVQSGKDLDNLQQLNQQYLYIEGVKIDQVVELSLVALHSMAKEKSIREELLHSPGVLTHAVQMLYSRSEGLQRTAVAFLSEMSVSSRAGEAIEREGAIPKLTELIQSNNEAIAAYSAAILHRAAYHKPNEYRKRLNQELRQSLFDGGVLNEDTFIQPFETLEAVNLGSFNQISP